MASLTLAQIAAAQDLGREEVDVPEWGGSVFLRQMSAGEHAKLGVDHESIPRDRSVFHLLALALCDETGALLFPGPADVEVLAGKNPQVINRLFERCMALNKLGESDVEGAEKN